jgi:hypothetical protein
MTRAFHATPEHLLETLFSDEPTPDIHAAVVVSHSGDECMGASWLLSRLHDRASVFRVTRGAHGGLSPDAVAMTGLPAERCHDLGLEAGTLGRDLETLTWLIAAAVKGVTPRVLITHAWEGLNLDHDAVAFAVQLTAQLLPRFGCAGPVVVEFQCHHESQEAGHRRNSTPAWEKGVRVDFGADSRRLKEQILRCQAGPSRRIAPASLRSEIYRPQHASNNRHSARDSEQQYPDAAWCTPREFLASATLATRSFAQVGLIGASII